MFVLIAGGGKVGYYLTKALLADNIECVLLEKELERAQALIDELGDAVMLGDAADPRVLQRAGIGRATVVIAVTGDDEDNLVICQLARAEFGANRTIARINNPKNERIFFQLGIDTTISPTKLVLAAIEADIPDQSMVHLATLRQYGLELVELMLRQGSPAVGKQTAELKLPVGSRLVGILRDGEALPFDRNMILLAGDVVLATTKPETENALRLAVSGTAATSTVA